MLTGRGVIKIRGRCWFPYQIQLSEAHSLLGNSKISSALCSTLAVNWQPRTFCSVFWKISGPELYCWLSQNTTQTKTYSDCIYIWSYIYICIYISAALKILISLLILRFSHLICRYPPLCVVWRIRGLGNMILQTWRAVCPSIHSHGISSAYFFWYLQTK